MSPLPRKLDVIKTLVVHCADTPNGYEKYTVEDIRKWHVQDNKWDDIGYHYVIEVDGALREGRALTEIGSHAVNYNEETAGICLIGRDAFTGFQWKALQDLIIELRATLPCDDIRVIGHKDLSTKSCPGFDVYEWFWERQCVPLDKHVCEIRRYARK